MWSNDSRIRGKANKCAFPKGRFEVTIVLDSSVENAARHWISVISS
jgi:hypothetical protein